MTDNELLARMTGENYAILQAENPCNKVLTTGVNDALTRCLAWELHLRNFEHIPVIGHPNLGLEEHAFLVFDIGYHSTLALGEHFRQWAVLYNEVLMEVSTFKPIAFGTGRVFLGNEAVRQEYYTLLPGGTAFSLEMTK